MNKVGCFLCFSLMTANLWATEMCARNDTIVIPLDATIFPTGYISNPTENLYKQTFSFGAVYGAFACLSKKEVEMYNNGVMPAAYQPINTSSDELIASSGYYMNADTDPAIPDSEKPYYARTRCFVKTTHPISSKWIYKSNNNSPDSCNSDGGCRSSYLIGTNGSSSEEALKLRNALFSNIAIEQPK